MRGYMVVANTVQHGSYHYVCRAACHHGIWLNPGCAAPYSPRPHFARFDAVTLSIIPCLVIYIYNHPEADKTWMI